MTRADSVVGDYSRRATSAERFFTRSPFSIVTMVARINGNVTEEMLRSAVVKARQRHILLRVRVQDDQDHGQWFTSDGAQETPIEITKRQSQDDWIGVHVDASRKPFQFESRPAIRFILVQSPDASDLIILCHHMICDGMSLAYLARDLMVLLGDPDKEVGLLPAPKPIDLDN
ncbi:MAG: condensation domain-containing protein, partial [Chloroflexota bacterium]